MLAAASCANNSALVTNYYFLREWAELYNFKTIFPWEKETQMSKKR